MTWVLVAVGAALGAPLRYLVDRAVQARFGQPFPFGTLAVNVSGCLLLGLLTGLPAPRAVVALAGIGFCGAFTTYSTFGYETLRLARDGRVALALINVTVSVVVGLGAVYCGLLAGGALR